MPTSPLPSHPAISLSAYLSARREAILNMWRASCEADRTVHHTSSLSREEFNNEIPLILDVFEQRLSQQPDERKLLQIASEHGLHRWHKGYSLRELLTEIAHFVQCLTTEISCYGNFYPITDASVLPLAYEQVIQLNTELVDGSITRYDDLQRKQAANRADVLQQTLDRINALTRQRSKLLQMTSHDLRGGLGVITGAAVLLDRPASSDQERQNYLRMLQRNLLSVGDMLGQLTDLARLEAGQESIEVTNFDATKLIQSIVQSTQPLATERGLILRADGPDQLPVETDRIKVQRIVQNLLLNALRYTPTGLVSVSWSSEDSYRWTISIQDTGPGLPESLMNSIIAPLKPTVDSSSIFEREVSEQTPTGNVPPPVAPSADNQSTSGEGIGLYIVKRLSELLNANLDVETRPGEGTLFRVRLPTHHK